MSSAGRTVANKLFVSNLPWTVNPQKLRSYFSKYGTVVSANVVFDKGTGLSRGYGFVIFNNRVAFDAATGAAQKHSLEGNVIQLEPAN